MGEARHGGSPTWGRPNMGEAQHGGGLTGGGPIGGGPIGGTQRGLVLKRLSDRPTCTRPDGVAKRSRACDGNNTAPTLQRGGGERAAALPQKIQRLLGRPVVERRAEAAELVDHAAEAPHVGFPIVRLLRYALGRHVVRRAHCTLQQHSVLQHSTTRCTRGMRRSASRAAHHTVETESARQARPRHATHSAQRCTAQHCSIVATVATLAALHHATKRQAE
jgi:hypothetical protein